MSEIEHQGTTVPPTNGNAVDAASSTAHPAPVSTPAQYQPYPYTQGPYAPPPPRVIPYSKTWFWVNIGLTVASLVFSLILLGVSVAISIGPGYDTWNITAYWTAPFVIIAIIWDIAEFITIGACGKRGGTDKRRGIHPGAHVGVDLCLWLAGIVCIFFTVISYFSARSALQYCQDADNSSSRYYSYYSYCDDDENALLSQGIYVPAISALLAFLALLTLTHFVIFVRACVETNQRNRSRSAVMMMPASQLYYGPPPGAAPYGYPVVPPQAHMGSGQGNAVAEKSSAPVQPQEASPGLAGFYAPANGPHAAHEQAPPLPTRSQETA